MAHYLKKRRNKPLVIATTKNTSPLLWIAQQKGFLHDHDIKIKIRPVPYTGLNIELLLNDEIDIATFVEVNVTYLGFIKPKTPVKCFASTLGRYTDEILLRQAGATPEDLRGKTVGFMPRTSSHTYLMRFLNAYGLKKSDITLKEYKPQMLADALMPYRSSQTSSRRASAQASAWPLTPWPETQV